MVVGDVFVVLAVVDVDDEPLASVTVTLTCSSPLSASLSSLAASFGLERVLTFPAPDSSSSGYDHADIGLATVVVHSTTPPPPPLTSPLLRSPANANLSLSSLRDEISTSTTFSSSLAFLLRLPADLPEFTLSSSDNLGTVR